MFCVNEHNQYLTRPLCVSFSLFLPLVRAQALVLFSLLSLLGIHVRGTAVATPVNTVSSSLARRSRLWNPPSATPCIKLVRSFLFSFSCRVWVPL
jgi:hypothetical protein